MVVVEKRKRKERREKRREKKRREQREKEKKRNKIFTNIAFSVFGERENEFLRAAPCCVRRACGVFFEREGKCKRGEREREREQKNKKIE